MRSAYHFTRDGVANQQVVIQIVIGINIQPQMCRGQINPHFLSEDLVAQLLRLGDFNIIDCEVNIEAALLPSVFECCGFKHDVTLKIWLRAAYWNAVNSP